MQCGYIVLAILAKRLSPKHKHLSGMTLVIMTIFFFLQTGGFLSTTLRKVTLPTITDLECIISYPGKITDRMICAGTILGGKSACNVRISGY
jgi:hypothetical protein